MAGELFELDTNKSSSGTPDTPAETKKAKSTNGVDNKQLLSIVERIERMTEEKKAIAEDIKDIKVEAKSNGYDVKTITDMLKLRAMDKADRDAREALRDTYANALGIFG